MQFTGKKTERLWLPRQICVDPFLAAELRDRASRNSRKLEDEMRFIFMLGLKQEAEKERNEQTMTKTHME